MHPAGHAGSQHSLNWDEWCALEECILPIVKNNSYQYDGDRVQLFMLARNDDLTWDHNMVQEKEIQGFL